MIVLVSANTGVLQNSSHYQLGTIDDVVSYCKDKQVLGVDTETEGFDFTCKKLIMFQIGDQDNQFIIDTRFVSIEPLRDVLENKEITKIFHNAKFDLKFIRKWFNIQCEGIYDTFLAERVLHCGKKIGYSLKDLCKLRELQLIKISEYKLENVISLENNAVLALTDIEYNGLNINREAWEELAKHSEKESIEIAFELDDMILSNKLFSDFVLDAIQSDLFIAADDIRKINVKWTSPTQVLKVFNKLIPKLENVNGKELYKYRRKFKLIDKYIVYKEKMKLATSYGKDFFKFVSSDGKVHTNFNQILDTGRIASSNPNMQQIPANNKFRNCFIAPDGWCFVSSDYSSQELNVIAFGSKDPVWINALEKGQDLHSVCAELVYGDEWLTSAEDNCVFLGRKVKCNCPRHVNLRNNVKAINFGLAYGMGPNKLSDSLGISLSQAKELIETYFKEFPKIKEFLNKLGTFGKRYGYIKTFPPYNRRRWFPGWYPKIWNSVDKKMEVGSIERASKNTPIQGASADMTKLALHLIREYIKMTDAPVKIVMTVHDQIDTICQIEYAKSWVSKMTELMELAALQVVTNGLLKADTNFSKLWQK